MCIRIEGAIVCGLRNVKWCHCGRSAVALCDWKVPARQTGTCDRPLCLEHRHEVGRNKHLCSEHRTAYEAWKRRNQIGDVRQYQAQIAGQQVLMFPEAS